MPALQQCSLPAMRGCHLTFLSFTKWELRGDINVATLERENDRWIVSSPLGRVGNYGAAGAALSHAYSIATEPRKII